MSRSSVSQDYDLVIIGGGAAGLTAASAAVLLGVRVALVEGQRMGGECTWTGCIPSKTLLSVARLAHDARHAAAQGIQVSAVAIDFEQMMAYVQQTIQHIYEDESPATLRDKGIDVYESYARFTDANTLLLADGKELRSKRLLICTGAKPRVPAGFDSVPYLTNETLFDLQELPSQLIIVGGGPMGVEMAQAFQRLGSQVTLISGSPQILPRDDAEAAALIATMLRAEGVDLRLGVTSTHATQDGNDITVFLDNGTSIEGGALLLAVGKQPNIESLSLEAAGVKTRAGKLILDDRLRTTQPHILAAGDVTGGPQFTIMLAGRLFRRCAMLCSRFHHAAFVPMCPGPPLPTPK